MNHWSKEYIQTLYDEKVVQGRDAENFAPDENLTRAEMVKIALEMVGFVEDKSAIIDYPDVAMTDWFYKYVRAATRMQIVGGYPDGTFKPNAPITRAEALKILLSAFGAKIAGVTNSTFSDINQTAWYADFVDFAFAQGIVSGKGENRFAPDDFVTRAEMTKMAVLTMKAATSGNPMFQSNELEGTMVEE